MDEYLVPTGFGEAELIEKRSRFIGHVWRITSEEEALSHLKEMREKYWDANHNVYAYSIKSTGISRYSDDGEPQGTAGIPVLNVFRLGELEDFCCVVTRYFGGILLGAGGLVRAYSKAASLALEAAGRSTMRSWRNVRVRCEYRQFERVRLELVNNGAVLGDIDYGADVNISAMMPDKDVDAFDARLTDVMAGTVKLERFDAEFKAL